MKLQRYNTKSAKLTAVQVVEIRRRAAEGETQSSLCRLFGVSVIQIGRIVRGESWQALPAVTEEDMAQSQANLMIRLGMTPETTTAPLERMIAEANKEKERNDQAEELIKKLTGDSK